MSTATKRCCTCQRDVPLSGFNRRARASDGLQSRCRECCGAWYEANRVAHKANVRRRNDRVRTRWRERLVAYLAEHPCVDCGETDVRCLEFDHRDASAKAGNVTRMVALAMPWATIQAEIEKCDVRCANCHRRITTERGRHWRQQVHEQAQAQLAHETSARLERVLPQRVTP
jgi:hypothetical protein